jgi:hypothetical protein
MNKEFTELNERELYESEGGAELLLGALLGWLIDGYVEHVTGKSIGGWIDTGLDALGI